MPLPQREHPAQVAVANIVKPVEDQEVLPLAAQAEHKQEPRVSLASCSARLKSMSPICTKAMRS